jgi:hypothetical protein
MPGKQQKGCSNVYTKSATAFSTGKLDLHIKEDILYHRVVSHKKVGKGVMSAVSAFGVQVPASWFKGSEVR